METANAIALVVKERTGHLSISTKREIQGRAAVAIAAQVEGELPSVFAARVMRRVAKQDIRQRPSTGVLCCGTPCDDAHWLARQQIANALLSAIADTGELVIAACQDAGRNSLSRFLDLVDELRRHGSPSCKCVRLRFDRDSQPHDGDRRSEHEVGTPIPWGLPA